MGNFEKLSVLVIVVIIVMILVVALYTWTEDPNAGATTATADAKTESGVAPAAPPPGTNPNRVNLEQPPKGPAGKGTPLAGAPSKNDGKPNGFADLFPPARQPEGSQPVSPIDPGAPAPSPAPDPASVAPAAQRFHVVVSGDSYAKIAKQEYPGMGQRAIDELIKANTAIEPSRMRPGQKVLLPELTALAAAPGSPGTSGTPLARTPTSAAELRPGAVYVVRQGDTLPGISKRAYSNAGRWQDIWIENFGAIDDPDHLHAGTRLKLPK